MTDDRDCGHALTRLYEFLDHEIEEADADEIRAHLDACEPCLERYGAEEAVRAMIKRCCQSTHAPEGLRLRVMTQITATTVFYRHS